MIHILKCRKCDSYTMAERCSCGGDAVSPRPPKFSPDDKFGKYRREVKKESLVRDGLL